MWWVYVCAAVVYSNSIVQYYPVVLASVDAVESLPSSNHHRPSPTPRPDKQKRSKRAPQAQNGGCGGVY